MFVWDLKTYSALFSFTASTVSVAGLSVYNGVIVTGSFGGRVKLWDLRTGELIEKIQFSQANITCLRHSPDGRFLAWSSFDCSVTVFDL